MECLAVPCSYMIFDEHHYHGCSLLNGCLCAWFYDLGNPDLMIELEIDRKTGKAQTISDHNFPEIIEEKRRRCMTEADVPKMCPRGYTLKQIDAKIKAFDSWLRR